LKVSVVVMCRAMPNAKKPDAQKRITEHLTRNVPQLAPGYKQRPEQIAVIGSTKQIDTSIP